MNEKFPGHECSFYCTETTHVFFWGRVPGAPWVTSDEVRVMARRAVETCMPWKVVDVKEVFEHGGTIRVQQRLTNSGTTVSMDRVGRLEKTQQVFRVALRPREEVEG